MGQLPVLGSREVIAILERMGFEEVTQRGLTSSFGTQTVEGRPYLCTADAISPLLLRQIIKDIRSTPEEFLRYR